MGSDGPIACLHHTLVLAHPDRVATLAELLAALGRSVARGPIEALERTVARWNRQDLEREWEDLTELDGETRATIDAGVERALACARRVVEESPGEVPEAAELPDRLRDAHRRLPAAIPRAGVVRIRRSVGRFGSLAALDAPEIFLWNEARLLAELLVEVGVRPIEAATDVASDPADADDLRARAGGLALRGLDLCVVTAPGRMGGANLGLGVHATGAMALRRASTRPWAKWPWVPRRPLLPVGLEIEGLDLLGWARGEELGELARDLRAVAKGEPQLAARLDATAAALDAAGPDAACIGCVEELPEEAEGEPTFLVDVED